MKKYMMTMAVLVLSSCYQSGTTEVDVETTCETFCRFVDECEASGVGVHYWDCFEDCSTSPWWEATSDDCRVGVSSLMTCLSSGTCEEVETYSDGEPFSEVDYPCKSEEEFATVHDCAGEEFSLWR